jgi:ubiquinone/menaquinone biosynthesis C-methylase UbiE
LNATRIVTTLEELEAARQDWYERLAEFMARLVDWRNVSVLLEAGCGRGQLTIPLVRRLHGRCKIIGYDLSAGPYEGDLEALRKIVKAERLERIIETVEGNVTDMHLIVDESVDLIISNELFGELDRAGSQHGLEEFYRVLKRKGQMVLAELSPVAENKAQELLIEAIFTIRWSRCCQRVLTGFLQLLTTWRL